MPADGLVAFVGMWWLGQVAQPSAAAPRQPSATPAGATAQPVKVSGDLGGLDGGSDAPTVAGPAPVAADPIAAMLQEVEQLVAAELAVVESVLNPDASTEPNPTAPATVDLTGKRKASQVRDNWPDVAGLPVLGVPVATTATATGGVGSPAAPASTVAAQVAMQLSPLRKGPDGVHRLTIHLNPADLGTISVVAEVRNGAISVQIHGATEAARAALHAALPELRRDLVEAGFGSCSLDLQQNGPGQGHRSWDQPGGSASQNAPRQNAPRQNVPDVYAEPAPAPTTPQRGAVGAVDLHV